MKKALLLLLCLLVPLQAALAQAGRYTATVQGGALHLRAQADQASQSLGRYKSGTEVEVLADGQEFLRVRTQDGKEGYMMKSFLRFEGGLPPMEVVTPTPAPTPDPNRLQALERGIDPNKPMIALTFDDGPMPESMATIEALNRHGARGTFFILGKNIKGNEEVLKAMVDGGHQVAAHSWSHPNFTEVAESTVMSQLKRTVDKVEEVTGYRITMMRPPYGALHRISRRPLVALGMPAILWSVDSLDWKTRSASATVREVLDKAKDGAIILCHDVWSSTGSAMETIVPELMNKGFQLVTVAEMMSFRSEPLKPGWEYGFLDREKIEPGLTPLPPQSPPPPADLRP